MFYSPNYTPNQHTENRGSKNISTNPKAIELAPYKIENIAALAFKTACSMLHEGMTLVCNREAVIAALVRDGKFYGCQLRIDEVRVELSRHQNTAL